MMRSGDTISARIFRYDPAKDEKPRYETVEVPFEKDMRVLDVLDYAVDNLGLGIGYRWFCGVKRCGMCGVSVNGKAVLACWEAAQEEMVIEPLANFPVIRDLVVDRSDFEKATTSPHGHQGIGNLGPSIATFFGWGCAARSSSRMRVAAKTHQKPNPPYEQRNRPTSTEALSLCYITCV